MYFISADYFGYIIILLIIVMIIVFPSQKISYNIYKGKIPNFIKNFPIYISSEEEVNETMGKIIRFLESLPNSLESKLEINQNDLNNLYTRGEAIIMLMPGRYVYYEIQDNNIIQRSILWPSVTLKGYSSQTDSITFFLEDNKLFQRRIVLEQDDKKFNDEVFVLATCSVVLLLIFSLGICKGDNTLLDRETTEYKNFETIINSIKNIKIENNTLVIQI